MSEGTYFNTANWQDMHPLVKLCSGSYDKQITWNFVANGVPIKLDELELNYDSTFKHHCGAKMFEKGMNSCCDSMMINIIQHHPMFKKQDTRSKNPYEPTPLFEQSEMILSRGESVRPVKQTIFCFKLVDGEWVHDPKIIFDSHVSCLPDNFIKIHTDGTIEIIAQKYGSWDFIG